MNLARVRDGVVVNIEVADTEWLSAAQATKNDDSVELIEYTDDAPAHIGYRYNPEQGFEQPPDEDEQTTWRQPK